MTELKCPFKFSHYEFEGGQECIGSECGMFKRCNVGSAFVAGNAKQATVDANDAPPKGTFQVSHDYGSTFSPPVKIQGEQDSSEKLEADALALVDNLRVYGCNYAGDAEVEIIGMLDRQAAITDSECRSEFNVLDEHAQALERENEELQARVDELTERLESAHAKNRSLRQHIAKMQEGRHGWHVKGTELQKQVGELTAENAKLSSDELHLRQALASAEFDNATLRDKLGRMLDNAHEITRIGGDC